MTEIHKRSFFQQTKPSTTRGSTEKRLEQYISICQKAFYVLYKFYITEGNVITIFNAFFQETKPSKTDIERY